MTRQGELVAFFERYAATSMGAVPQDLAACYDTSFLAAGPQGGAAFQNDEAFLGWLQQVHDFNEGAGMTALEVVAVGETPISNEYVLASVRWGARFRVTGDEVIEFEISYLLRVDGDSFKVAAYVSHEDQEAVMRERGLL
ncbi:MAG: hypothetical protein IT299_08590 [Dehalococcoidia bacterium]|nr:hypothetical protein [Dehalococcoidia bacterium]